MSINLRKTLGIIGVSALLAVPVAVSSANVSASANANPYQATINWNNKYGTENNSIDHQPAVSNPAGIQLVQGQPSAKTGSQFEFTVPGSDYTYAASWRSPLAHQLLAQEAKKGNTQAKAILAHKVTPVQANRINRVNAQHQAVVPQKATENKQAAAPKAQNRGKLAQTNENDSARNAGIVAGIVAMASVAVAGVAKFVKRA